MKRKKVIVIVALIATLAIAATLLAACNDVYVWDGIGMGESQAKVVSNGGYYVEQGKYVYFINGYLGDVEVNNWGSAYKQSIMRAEKNSDGTINNDTAQVVVPLVISNQYTGGGFAVFGDWIYYASPNTESDTSGNPNTTYTDFMRTRTDGAVTQRIGNVNSRSCQYLFTPTRVLYTDPGSTSTLRYFDFTGMPSGESVDDGSGVKMGVLIENASGILWGYDAEWDPSAGTVVTDYIFYTQTVTGDDSYRHYNELCAVKYDGSDRKTLATYDSSVGVADYDKVFTYSLKDVCFVSDTEATLYYTKSIYENGSSKSQGLYMNTFSLSSEYSVQNEKRLAQTEPSSFYALGGDKGILATVGNNVYLVTADSVGYTDANLIIGTGSSVKVEKVIGNYVYYTASNALYRINLDVASGDSANVREVIASGVKTDWLKLDFAGSRLVWFNTDDYGYLYYLDGLDLDTPTDGFEGKLLGKMTQEDLDAKAEEEEEE